MSWLGLVLFVVGNLLLRLIGMFVLGHRLGADDRFTRLAGLVPLAIVAGVVAIQTFAIRRNLVIDARVLGVAAAGVAAWRRAPLALVVLIAAAVTAGVRLAGWT